MYMTNSHVIMARYVKRKKIWQNGQR